MYEWDFYTPFYRLKNFNYILSAVGSLVFVSYGIRCYPLFTRSLQVMALSSVILCLHHFLLFLSFLLADKQCTEG